MKLYYSKGACSLACRITINELGLKSEYEAVDLAAKKTEKNEDFFKINPKGAVPALALDNGEVLTENAVILQYLADTSKNHRLLPAIGDLKRYRVLEWLNYVATEMHKGFGALFNPKVTPEMREKIYDPMLRAKLTYLDKHFEHNTYLMGDEYTLPDGYLFVTLTWTLYFKFNLNEWKHLARYFNELKQRQSVAASLQQEGLD